MTPVTSSAAPSLLIVDDEPIVLAALKETLEREKYHVVATTKPLKALEILRTQERIIWEHRELLNAIRDRDIERARSMIRLQFRSTLGAIEGGGDVSRSARDVNGQTDNDLKADEKPSD